MSSDGKPRNIDSRSIHCSKSCRRCTKTKVLTPRCAISHAASTVLPKAVVAAKTPVSWASIAWAAACCSGRNSPQNWTVNGAPHALVANDRLDVQVRKEFLDLFETASWQTNVLQMVFGATNDTRFAVGRQPHSLGFVEFRILKRCKSKQAVSQSRRQRFLGDVDSIGEYQF